MTRIKEFNNKLRSNDNPMFSLSEYEQEYLKNFKKKSKKIEKYYERYVKLYKSETKDDMYFQLDLNDKNVVFNFKEVIDRPDFDPNMVSSKNITPLMFLFNWDIEEIYDTLTLEKQKIFQNNIFEITKMLIEKGGTQCVVNNTPDPDYSIVGQAIQHTYVNLETIKLMLPYVKDITKQYNNGYVAEYEEHSFTLISEAIIQIIYLSKPFELIECIFNYGVDINMKINKHFHILYYPTSVYHFVGDDDTTNIACSIVEFLLDRGANMDVLIRCEYTKLVAPFFFCLK